MGKVYFNPNLELGDEFDMGAFTGRNMKIGVIRGNGSSYTFEVDLNTGFVVERRYGFIIPTGQGEIPANNPYGLFKFTTIPNPKLVVIEHSDGHSNSISYIEGTEHVAPEVFWEANPVDNVITTAHDEGTTVTAHIFRTGQLTSAINLNIGFIQGTAHADDVISFPPSVTIPAGASWVDIPIVLAGGPEYETNQSFLLVATVASAIGGETWRGNTARQITILETSAEPEPEPTPVLGCTDPTANNYNPLANQDDGSCTFDPPVDTSDCRVVGDLLEVEHWFKVNFIEPDNGEQLHDQDLISYKWSGTWQAQDEVNLYAYSEKNRVAMFMFTKELEVVDSEITVGYEVTALARDLRFTQLDVTDEDSKGVEFELPCVIEGNSPDFSIGNVTITEPSSGTVQAMLTITASEAVTGRPITIDYCSADITASSFSSSVEVQHVAYDKNVPPQPFLSYLDHGDVRVVFDASFPKFYNVRYADANYVLAWRFLTNAVAWLNRKGGTKALFIGERSPAASGTNGLPDTAADGSYDIKSTGGSGFYDSIRPHLASLGYTVDVEYTWDFGTNPGSPSAANFMEYDVIVYMSSWYLAPTDRPLSSIFVSSLESAVRQRTGLMVITDHTNADGTSFATAGNQIAGRFYAEFSGSINRNVGTDFDAVRTEYGDHPLIAGLNGVMPGDSSEGKVETNALTVSPDYEPACGSVTFQAGEASKQIPVTINTDSLFEPSETLSMTLTNPTRGQVVGGPGIVTIEEWIIPTVTVTLVSQGAKKQLFVGRDTSGSTDAAEVTVNGVANKARRFLMEQILTDYNIASCTVPMVTGHGNDGCSDNSNALSHYTGVAGASSALTVDYINSIQPSIDADTEEISILVMNDSSDAISHDSTVWASDWAWIAAWGKPVTMTFIRVIGQNFIDGDTGNYQAARLWFESVVAAAPANVTAYFKSYSSYTTGAANDLNDILSSTVNNDYNAVCNARPDDVVIVSAADEDAALALAEGSISCP